ncbi:phosphonoacetate hydrolase [Dongia mobilis]|uniref:Phosphonoacetate hydrolase n=1 Tax=Dongia mobilis TaxID=578943 RepID=A0A4R6WHE9_9PROT|nr:phosphonoacetate hydrolase [Dongia mobilis]TDQ77705.1 phosphonoacetate hydrolase [Dongia mobilis]
MQSVTVNGMNYAAPQEPIVIVCVDGCEPDYLKDAIAAGVMPWLKAATGNGADLIGDCVVPSFTNPNNLSIVTGAPPSVHGICGNYLYDRESGQEVMMNDPKFLRAETILAAFSKVGAKVAVVTAKDKLRKLLGKGMAGGICFSAEKANETTKAENGIDNALGFVGLPLPSVYSADLSEFVFAAGVKLMQAERPDIMYLSTTDYIQHKHAPGTAVANDFYKMMDGYLGQLEAMGCTIVLTADHGMNDKHGADGKPQVIYLQDVLDQWIGAGKARVILPITDPYVVHHGALGSFATIYLPDDTDHAELIARMGKLPGMELVVDRVEGCRRFELPEDRLGDVIAVSARNFAIGTSVEKHDLSGLTVPLRSHGGMTEQKVPVIVNRKLKALPAGYRLRNFSAFDLACNYAIPAAQPQKKAV